MAKLMGTFHNATTGEVEVRELTAEETAFFEAQQAAQAAAEEAATEKAAARAALLTRLGMTEEEAQLLLGGN